MEQRKQIGFKAPYDLFQGQVKKGTLFTNKSIVTFYNPKEGNLLFYIPAEIVESSWEKVYEEVPKFKEWDWVVCIRKPFEKASVTLNKAAQLTTYGNKGNLEFEGFAIIGDVDSTDCFRFAMPQEIEDASTKTIRMGGGNGFDLTIKGGEVFHKSEDITRFVTEMENWHLLNRINKEIKCDKYTFKIDDITFSKVGCEHTAKTKLSEWLKVAEMIK